MWTGAVVSYARPFKASRFRVGERWERFRDYRDLGRLHRELLELRSKVFAHTDAIEFREVWWDRETLQLHEERANFRRNQALAVKHLCGFQMNRMADRIEELLATLQADQGGPDKRAPGAN